MADLSELRGCVVVQPRPREHVIEIADSQCTPGKELYICSHKITLYSKQAYMHVVKCVP